MAQLDFNTAEGQEIERALLVFLINVGTYEAPDWAPIGRGVEDNSLQYDWQEETKKDILGNTHNTMKTPIVSGSFDPWPMAKGDKAQKHLWNLAVKEQNAAALSKQDVLVMHKYVGEDNAFFAERYDGTQVKVTSIGGEGGGSLVLPTDVTLGGNRTIGKVAISAEGVVTYTKDAA